MCKRILFVLSDVLSDVLPIAVHAPLACCWTRQPTAATSLREHASSRCSMNMDCIRNGWSKNVQLCYALTADVQPKLVISERPNLTFGPILALKKKWTTTVVNFVATRPAVRPRRVLMCPHFPSAPYQKHRPRACNPLTALTFLACDTQPPNLNLTEPVADACECFQR